MSNPNHLSINHDGDSTWSSLEDEDFNPSVAEEYRARHMAHDRAQTESHGGRHLKRANHLRNDSENSEGQEPAQPETPSVNPDSIIYSEENYKNAKERIRAELLASYAQNQESETQNQESETQGQGYDHGQEDDKPKNAGAVAEKIAAIRADMGEDPSPVELTKQDKHDLLVTELRKSGSMSEFRRTFGKQRGWDLMDDSEYRQLFDEVAITATERRITELKSNIDALNRAAQDIETEMAEPNPFKRLWNRMIGGSPKKHLEANRHQVARSEAELARIQSEDSDYYKALHREELEAKRRADIEQRAKERAEYLASTPVEEMAQNSKGSASEYIKALKNRGEYNLDNLLTFYEQAKRDSNADAYLYEARAIIKNNNELSDDEKERLNREVNRTVRRRMYPNE